MKALSLWQPWASLIAARIKTVETRHWYTDFRGMIAIHAAKRKMDRESGNVLLKLDAAQYNAFVGAEDGGPHGIALPYGAIVAVALLSDCRPTSQLKPDPWGNYETGRFGFVLDNIRPLATPISMVGRQGFFNVPAEIEEEIERQVANAWGEANRK